MNFLMGMLLRPDSTWAAIAGERMSTSHALRLILPLCLLPAAATVIGMSVFNTGWDAMHGYQTGENRIFAIGLANVLFAVITILTLALAFHWLAVPAGKARAPFAEALKLAGFGAVPVLLAGGLLVLPVMAMLTLVAAVYSLYLYHLGMQKLLGIRSEDAVMMLAICVVLVSVVAGTLGAVISAYGML
ncbi:MAG: YIP1 family protein [Vicinamibacterales bacterium]